MNEGNGNSIVTTYTANGTRTTPKITGLSYCFGIAVDAAGKIYVSSLAGGIGNNTVLTYTAKGKQTTPTIRG